MDFIEIFFIAFFIFYPFLLSWIYMDLNWFNSDFHFLFLFFSVILFIFILFLFLLGNSKKILFLWTLNCHILEYMNSNPFNSPDSPQTSAQTSPSRNFPGIVERFFLGLLLPLLCRFLLKLRLRLLLALFLRFEYTHCRSDWMLQ